MSMHHKESGKRTFSPRDYDHAFNKTKGRFGFNCQKGKKLSAEVKTPSCTKSFSDQLIDKSIVILFFIIGLFLS